LLYKTLQNAEITKSQSHITENMFVYVHKLYQMKNENCHQCKSVSIIPGFGWSNVDIKDAKDAARGGEAS